MADYDFGGCAAWIDAHATHEECANVHPTGHTCVEHQCASCGTFYAHPVAYHSGTRECGSCWEWRKLEGPAARYWDSAIEHLFVADNGSSGPDLNDYVTWRRMGIRDEVVEALNVLEALRVRYEIAIHGDADARRAALGY